MFAEFGPQDFFEFEGALVADLKGDDAEGECADDTKCGVSEVGPDFGVVGGGGGEFVEGWPHQHDGGEPAYDADG